MGAQVNTEDKLEMINIFVNAALAYELGSCWRGVFQRSLKTAAKSNVAMIRKWMTLSESQFDKTINNVLDI